MKLQVLLAFATATFAVPSVATPIIFFGEDAGLGEGAPLPTHVNADNARTNFLSRLIGAGVETFEGFSAGQTANLAVNFGAAGTATLTGSGIVEDVTPGTTNGVGRYAISGSKFWEASSGNFNISLSDPIAAFGFYGVDIGDFNGQITLTTAGGIVQNFVVPNTIGITGGSVLYWGIIDTADPFTSITFGNTAPGTDFFAFDDFTIGTREQVRPVPLPGALSLLGVGMLGLAATRRRACS